MSHHYSATRDANGQIGGGMPYPTITIDDVGNPGGILPLFDVC